MMLNTFTERRMEDAVFLTLTRPRLASFSRRAFTALAGLAADLRPLPADAACCTGPFGSGQCSSSMCLPGAPCSSVPGFSCYTVNRCQNLTTYHWTSDCGGECYDCGCSGPYTYYCYCYI